MKLEKEIMIVKKERGYYYDEFVFHTTELLSHEDFEKIASLINKKIKLTLEVEEPILDEEERRYLSGVIRPFRDRIRYITKNAYIMSGDKREFISICTFNGVTPLPYFKAGTMYTNMELNKEYTLDDLNL